MDNKMTEQKALRDAVLTVGLAVLLVSGVLFYLVRPISENWVAIIVITLVPALLMLPVIHTRYVKGPPPPLTRQQHFKRALIFGLVACLGTVLIFTEHKWDWGLVWKCCYVGGWLATSIKHFRLSYREEQENPVPIQ